MTKRQLDKDEKELSQKSIERMTQEIKDLMYLQKDAELKFNEGLDYSYRKQKKEYKEAIEQIKQEIESKKRQMEILATQMKYGVDPKPKSTMPGV